MPLKKHHGLSAELISCLCNMISFFQVLGEPPAMVLLTGLWSIASVYPRRGKLQTGRKTTFTYGFQNGGYPAMDGLYIYISIFFLKRMIWKYLCCRKRLFLDYLHSCEFKASAHRLYNHFWLDTSFEPINIGLWPRH